MAQLKVLAIVSIAFFCLAYTSDAQAVSKEWCSFLVKKMKTIPEFVDFAEITLEYDRTEAMSDEKSAILNRCVHSKNGFADILALKELVEQAGTVHSVCEPDFADKLVKFNKQLKANASQSKYLKRLQKHRLAHFFRLFAGQVVLTCKESLVQKLQSAENSNADVAASINTVTAMLEEKNTKADENQAKNLPKGNLLLNFAKKFTPNVFTRVENLLLTESLKPTPDSEFSIGLTLSSQGMVDDFLKAKRACKLIDRFAQSSIYTIARLAWKGYFARKDFDTLDDKLSADPTVQKWIKAVQFCQGVLLADVKLDLESDVIDKMKTEQQYDESLFTVNVDKENHLRESAHKFEQADNFNSFDPNLECYTQTDGVNGFLQRRLGSQAELVVSKYVKVNILDESIKRSILENQEDPEGDVQFGGTEVTSTGHGVASHVTSHIAAHSHHAAHVGWHIAVSVLVGVLLGYLTAYLLRRKPKY